MRHVLQQQSLFYFYTLREKCINGFFSGQYFPAFGLSKSPYSVQMRENTDQKNSVFEHFSRSDMVYQYIFFF